MPLIDFYPVGTLNEDQLKAVTMLDVFLNDTEHQVFILKGYAGTGKTYLMDGIVKYARDNSRPVHCMAPTGRAARVIGSKTKTEATTIHSLIFKFEDADFTEDDYKSKFKTNDQNNTDGGIYLVDEASMVSDVISRNDSVEFGSGRLLSDLFEYLDLRKNTKSKIVFLGDPAQLSPVGDDKSPAMDEVYMEQRFQLKCLTAQLTMVMRQGGDSGILKTATRLRADLARGNFSAPYPDEATDVRLFMGKMPLMDHYYAIKRQSPSKDNDIFIAHANATVLEYNNLVRFHKYKVVGAPLQAGDYLMAVANNSMASHKVFNGDFLNILEVEEGEEVETVEVNIRSQYQKEDSMLQLIDKRRGLVTLKFKTVLVRPFLSEEQYRMKILSNFLDSPDGNLPSHAQSALYKVMYRKIKARYADKDPFLLKAALKDALLNDPYKNALIVKYGYSITCHKAQGGEWPNVYVDAYRNIHRENVEYYRWLYTAVTRAQKDLSVSAPHYFIKPNQR